MSQSASQAAAFYREVAKSRIVWTLQDKAGFPAPMTSSGQRAMPFWSSKSRVERIIATVPAYAGFTPHEIGWDDFAKDWAKDLEKDGLLVGVNWSGSRATGYDMSTNELVAKIEATSTGWKPPWRAG